MSLISIEYSKSPNPFIQHSIASLKFDVVPNTNELIKACGEATTAVRPHENSIMGWRHIGNSADELEYRIFCVDVWAELQKEKEVTDDYWICEVELSCRCCRAVYKGWVKKAKKWGDKSKQYTSTEYCPKCPPVDINAWLVSTVYILTEKPAYTNTQSVFYTKKERVERPIPNMTVDMSDFPMD